MAIIMLWEKNLVMAKRRVKVKKIVKVKRVRVKRIKRVNRFISLEED